MKDRLISLFGEKWFYKLEPFLLSPELLELGKIINNLRLERKIYPENYQVFNSFKESNPDDINVVFLINQNIDKHYCHPICGCGSYFTSKIMRNWQKELIFEYPELDNRFLVNGSLDWQDLKYLREQDIFFLNTQLTDDEKLGWKHEKLWKPIMVEVVKVLSKNENIIWILLGDNCFEYEKLIPLQSKVIKTPHPALNEFTSSGVFRKINIELSKNERRQINW